MTNPLVPLTSRAVLQARAHVLSPPPHVQPPPCAFVADEDWQLRTPPKRGGTGRPLLQPQQQRRSQQQSQRRPQRLPLRPQPSQSRSTSSQPLQRSSQPLQRPRSVDIVASHRRDARPESAAAAVAATPRIGSAPAQARLLLPTIDRIPISYQPTNHHLPVPYILTNILFLFDTFLLSRLCVPTCVPT